MATWISLEWTQWQTIRLLQGLVGESTQFHLLLRFEDSVLQGSQAGRWSRKVDNSWWHRLTHHRIHGAWGRAYSQTFSEIPVNRSSISLIWKGTESAVICIKCKEALLFCALIMMVQWLPVISLTFKVAFLSKGERELFKASWRLSGIIYTMCTLVPYHGSTTNTTYIF